MNKSDGAPNRSSPQPILQTMQSVSGLIVKRQHASSLLGHRQESHFLLYVIRRSDNVAEALGFEPKTNGAKTRRAASYTTPH